MHGLTSSLSRRLAVQAGGEDGVEIEPGARDQRGLRQRARARRAKLAATAQT